MAEEEDKKEEEFRLTPEGEAGDWITLEQARVRAIEHARDNTGFYGPRYRGINLVWELDSQEEGEEYYDIKLSFRPAGSYSGQPGIEQFIMEKTGAIRVRQILGEPSELGRPGRRGPLILLLTAVGVVIVAAIAVGVVVATGGNTSDDGPLTAAVIPTDTPILPTAMPVPNTLPLPTAAPGGLVAGATPTPAPVSPTALPRPTPTWTPVPTPTRTPTPTSTPRPSPTLLAQVPCPQAQVPHLFYGAATLAHGFLLPDNTGFATLVGGADVATTTVESSFQPRFYYLNVTPPLRETFVGQIETITAGGMASLESANWQTWISQGLNAIASGPLPQQPEAPHRFFGTATLADGSLAPDGTVVSAWVGDEEAGTAVVESSFQAGFYLLDVTPARGASYVGQMVTFLVDGVSTGDSVAWVTRTSQELNLTASGVLPEQPQAPHEFFGTATLADGCPAPNGTVVAALVGGDVVATTRVESSFQAGFYLLDVTPPIGKSYVGQMVTFTIGGVATGDRVAWVT